MVYEFVNDDTQETILLDKGDILNEDGSFKSVVQREGKKFRRVYGSKITIPSTWHDDDFHYDKSPSGRKHFY